jgi:hypothetical protein
MAYLTRRRRDPDANQETWLIYDIRVDSIAKRQGPMELESSVVFGVAPRLPAGSASHSMRARAALRRQRSHVRIVSGAPMKPGIL